MAITRELKVVYGSITCGAGTARQITDYTLHEEEYERGYFEFEIVTTAATEAAFVTEIQALEAEFRKPRLDLVVTLGSTNFLTRKHSDNTALDTSPTIWKTGDPADTGRSRHYRIRIEYGLPADNVSTSFRRWSEVNVQYSPSRRRMVTIRGVYTAENSDDNTLAFAQYRSQIDSYASTVTAAIDSTVSWETIGEPRVERNETDKIVEFEIILQETVIAQSNTATDDTDIVDPILTIDKEQAEPGDSLIGGIGVSGGGGVGIVSTSGSVDTVAQAPIPGAGGASSTVAEGAVQRPTYLTVQYSCGINKENLTGVASLKTKYESTIRPFLIAQAKLAATGVIMLEEVFTPDPYQNRIDARLRFIVYTSVIFEQRISYGVSTNYGRRLASVWSGNDLDYYEWPGPVVQIATSIETYKQTVSSSNPKSLVDDLTANPPARVAGLLNDEQWMLMSRNPVAVVLRQGKVVGGRQQYIAEVTLETVAQRRNKRRASVQNFGGVTGAGLTG